MDPHRKLEYLDVADDIVLLAQKQIYMQRKTNDTANKAKQIRLETEMNYQGWIWNSLENFARDREK